MSEDGTPAVSNSARDVAGDVVQIGIVHGDVTITPRPPLVVTPRQLPADVALFTGRVNDLSQLAGFLHSARSPALVISAIAGTAGVGKTALALHWAHRVRDRFPDGDLYLNLRGYDPEPPISPDEALAHFLGALGVPASDLPPTTAEKSTLYRSLLATRKVLVVLDNASSDDQVRALLPGNPECVVLVTSRSAMAGLVARDGAQRLTLDLLSEAEAVTLLREVVRTGTEDAVLADLARLCSYLPLALRIAGEIIAFRPHRPIADLVAELADERDRLDVLSRPEDDTAAVRAVFSWSYRTLSDGNAAMFRRLGLHVSAEFSGAAAAALAGVEVRTAQHSLDSLARAHLVEEPAPGRFRFHDLLRAYATEKADHDETAEDRADAQARMLAFYRDRAEAVAAASGRHLVQEPPHSHLFTNARDAQSWCNVERTNLLAAAKLARRLGDPAAWRIPVSLSGFFGNALPRDELQQVCESALVVASTLGDRRGRAWALHVLADVHSSHRDFSKAADLYGKAFEEWQLLDDARGQALSLYGRGVASWNAGSTSLSGQSWERALRIWRSLGDASGEAIALSALSQHQWLTGRQNQAYDLHAAATELIAAGHTRYDGLLPRPLPRTFSTDFDGRTGYLSANLIRHQKAGNRLAEAYTLWDLADVDQDDSVTHLESALEIFADLDVEMHAKTRQRLDELRSRRPRSDAVEPRMVNSETDWGSFFGPRRARRPVAWRLLPTLVVVAVVLVVLLW